MAERDPHTSKYNTQFPSYSSSIFLGTSKYLVCYLKKLKTHFSLVTSNGRGKGRPLGESDHRFTHTNFSPSKIDEFGYGGTKELAENSPKGLTMCNS